MDRELIEIEYTTGVCSYSNMELFGAKIYHKGLDQLFVINPGWNKTESEAFNSQIERKIVNIDLLWRVFQYSSLETLLVDGLNIPNKIKFEELKRNIKFQEPHPETMFKSKFDELIFPTQVKLNQLPERPKATFLRNKPIEEQFAPSFNLLDSIFGKDRKRNIAKQNFIEALEEWNYNNDKFENELKQWEINHYQISCDNKIIQEKNEQLLKNYESKKSDLAKSRNDAIINWNKLETEFYSSQKNYNKSLNEIEKSYANNDYSVVAEYSRLILEFSKYPYFISKKFDIEYNSETKILVIEYALPPIDLLPTLKDFKLIKNEWKEYYISDTQLQKNFEQTMYNITLRTIFELFHTDTINALESICFNGWVNAINKATGKRENNCILSVQTKKEDFLEIDLRNVDPKTCFKSLKGVSSSKLSAITSIQPIIQINKTDKRFVDSHDITGSIDDSTNLAAMDWEDFEHLIREVFEKEFQSNGGEVKVTQASRDGGVDAIAFDPDPIRGGKIVIQAKRYTNTVGVSAVRDLFGTVMNEGATKGILVTTSDYGSDSYEFAKGKPLTLLNGANLLYLLEKHGHSAKIDIEEARRLMKN
jgi:restriction system protein